MIAGYQRFGRYNAASSGCRIRLRKEVNARHSLDCTGSGPHVPAGGVGAVDKSPAGVTKAELVDTRLELSLATAAVATELAGTKAAAIASFYGAGPAAIALR